MKSTNTSIFKKLNDKRGFSLVEVLVATALTTVIMTVMMHIQQNQSKMQKKAETDYEITTVRASIINLLTNRVACTNTMDIGALSAGSQIPSIKNKLNDIVFESGKEVNNLVKIDEIFLSGWDETERADGTFDVDTSLRVNLTRTSKHILGGQKKTVKFPLQLVVDGGKIIKNCFTNIDAIGKDSAALSCENIGGTINENSGKCELFMHSSTPTSQLSLLQAACTSTPGYSWVNGYCNPSLPEVQRAVSVRFLKDYFKDRFSCPDGHFFQKIDSNGNPICIQIAQSCPNGFTMTGIRNNGEPICRGFNHSCAPGEVVTKINFQNNTIECEKGNYIAYNGCSNGQVPIFSDNKIICRNVGCGNNDYFQKINSDGSSSCRPLPTGSCPAGQYVSEIRPDGSVTCLQENQLVDNLTCPEGQSFTQMQNGTAVCSKLAFTSFTCNNGKLVTGFNSNGTPICSDLIYGSSSDLTIASDNVNISKSIKVNSGKIVIDGTQPRIDLDGTYDITLQGASGKITAKNGTQAIVLNADLQKIKVGRENGQSGVVLIGNEGDGAIRVNSVKRVQ